MEPLLSTPYGITLQEHYTDSWSAVVSALVLLLAYQPPASGTTPALDTGVSGDAAW
jgi:hypothetical protein